MARFKVTEFGTFWGSKEFEAETEDEAQEKYRNDPCTEDDYDYESNQFEVEEVSENDRED